MTRTQLLAEAITLRPDERRVFLDRNCPDPELRQRIEAMLGVEDRLRREFGAAAAGILDDEDAAQPVFAGTERFEIQRRLGSGGFGVVYLVKDKSCGAILALKTLSRTAPDARRRFKEEFRQLVGITHPNLVTLYEMLSQDDRWFFTMEYVDGEDFVSYASTDERLRDALTQLAFGVAALHATGHLHCDLKPQNVLVSREGRVVILDFGLATDISSAESYGHGTPDFMSPEQATAQPISAASDWYSVGVILYRCLTGRLPSWGPVAVAEIRPDAADLSALCIDLLQTDPALRPSAEEILRRLGAELALLEPGNLGRQSVALVGRDAQIAELQKALQQAIDGGPASVLIHGPSGIGKTLLARSFVEEAARSHDVLLLEGRCYEQEFVPYKGIDKLMDSLHRHLRGVPLAEVKRLLPEGFPALTKLFPGLADLDEVAQTADDPCTRARGFEALRELLERVSARRPVIVLIDDLQWGDADSAAVLRDLITSPQRAAILFLLIYRSEDAESSPALKQLLAARSSPHVIEMQLTKLDASSARRLAGELLGGEGEDRPELEALIETVALESRGNPFLLTELTIRSYTADSAKANHACVSVDDLVRRRASLLPNPARRLLEVVSIAGQPIDLSVARKASALEMGGYPEIARLRSERLVRTRTTSGPVQVEVYHDRIRKSIEGSLSQTESRQYHRFLAFAAEASGTASPRFLANHFRGAGLKQPAYEYAVRAGELAESVLAFEEAADAYRMSAELAEEESDRIRSQLKLSVALHNAGRPEEGAKWYRRAAHGARGPFERAVFDQFTECELGPMERASFKQWESYESGFDFFDEDERYGSGESGC